MTFTDAVKLLPLRPLKTIGSYTSYVSQAGTAELVANTKRCFFLSKPNLEVVDNTYSNNDGMGDEETVRDMTLIDILPIPLADTREERLVYTSLKPETNSGTNVFDDSVLALILNRDKGAFDNLPFSWAPSPQSAKKEIYDSFQHSIGTSNSVKRVGRMGSFIETVQNKLSCVITGLIIEVNDEFSDASVSLSGGVILAKKTCENINEWKLSNQNAFLPEKLSTDDNVKYVDVCLMYCRLHELICISLETKLPIYIPESLFDSISVDGMLSNMGGTDNDTNNKMTITAEAPRQVLKMMKNNNIKNTVNSSKGTADLVWEIYDARKFLKMTAVQKRALLRASNVNKLPRPSLGDSALGLLVQTSTFNIYANVHSNKISLLVFLFV